MGFLRLLESVRVPALDVLFSGITYFGDELAFLAWWGFSGRWQTSS